MKWKLFATISILTALAVITFGNLVKASQVPLEPTVTEYAPTPQGLLNFTNKERVRAGQKPLTLDPRLNNSAQQKADEISATGVYAHIGAGGKHGYEYIAEQNIPNCRGSENISADTDKSITSKQATENWMSSTAGHREALLAADAYSVGFGYANGIVVQHFCITI